MSPDPDMNILEAHAAQLMEHFETVRIFATRSLGQNTAVCTYGRGNYCAQYGQIAQWVRTAEMREIRAAMKEDEEEDESSPD